MILVLGSVLIRQGRYEEALAVCHEHVARSRKEQGCVAHAVHQDAENPLRLVFVEQWSDMAALDGRFRPRHFFSFAMDVNHSSRVSRGFNSNR